MKTKKEILKKYTGKGGLFKDTIKEIPNTLKGMGKNLVRGKVLSAIDPGGIRKLPWKGLKGGLKGIGRGVERAMRIESGMQKAKEAPYKEALEDAMAGRERYVPKPKTGGSIESDAIDMYNKRIKRN